MSAQNAALAVLEFDNDLREFVDSVRAMPRFDRAAQMQIIAHCCGNVTVAIAARAAGISEAQVISAILREAGASRFGKKTQRLMIEEILAA